jgi:hypothetical protein
MEKRKSLLHAAKGLHKTLGVLEGGESHSSDSEHGSDHRGRRTASSEGLVSISKSYTLKHTKRSESYKKKSGHSSLHRFLGRVREIFPKGRKGGEMMKKKKKKKQKQKQQNQKRDDVGGGKLQEKGRRRWEEGEKTEKEELAARRKERVKSTLNQGRERGEKELQVTSLSESDDNCSERAEKRRRRPPLKRSESSPSHSKGLGRILGEVYQVKKTEAQARVEAKNARAIAKKQQEVAAQEQEHRLQVAKAEHAAIDIFLERAAQRRRRTEERVGYRSCLDE